MRVKARVPQCHAVLRARTSKVQIFWEGQKNLKKKSPIFLKLLKVISNVMGDFFLQPSHNIWTLPQLYCWGTLHCTAGNQPGSSFLPQYRCTVLPVYPNRGTPFREDILLLLWNLINKDFFWIWFWWKVTHPILKCKPGFFINMNCIFCKYSSKQIWDKKFSSYLYWQILSIC